MTPLNYTLAVLTHGDRATVNQALASFHDKVKPAPSRVIIYCDGTAPSLQREWTLGMDNGWELRLGGSQRGFCKATAKLWHWASAPESEVELPPFVFWLEHDFVFLRPVDLEDLAGPLAEEPEVCQMQLMRTPVSREEIAAGGLFEMRWEDYTPRVWMMGGDDEHSWQQHRAYFTTNPSLMRTEFMRWNHWPDDGEPFCEGRFGIDLVERGFSYGVWGSGEPWVEHIGHRDRRGFGY